MELPRDITHAVVKMNYPQTGKKGFTLIEMMLVLGIIASIIAMLAKYSMMRAEQIRIDVTAVQMQQILNAGMAFYLNNGYWPSQASATTTCGTASSLSPLQTSPNNYLPPTINPPFIGASYTMNCDPNTGVFQVTLAIPYSYPNGAVDAQILTGILPLSSVSTTTPVAAQAGRPASWTGPVTFNPGICGITTPFCPSLVAAVAAVPAVTGGIYVTAQVNIPGQNLNNARSINFGNFYHNGGCVPAPVCPSGMTPDILVVPASLYGLNDVAASSDFYPLYGFTAYAVGLAGSSPPSSTPAIASNVADCNPATTSATQCYSTCPSSSPGSNSSCTAITATSSALYWRVCVIVRTEKGIVSQDADSTWGQYVSLLAITRCVPVNENSGSDFSVWTQ
jgi:prepilin-type N-terminal cleavage/methylation domain-containing protein